MLLQGNHPPVEQVPGPDTLAAKVIDDEHSTVGLHLRRRPENAGQLVELKLQIVEHQLTADHDDGPPDPQPASVVFRFRLHPVGTQIPTDLVHGLVEDGVVDRDDLPIDLHRKRNVDRVA